jgi:alpha,alpha-trehalase
LITTRCTSGRVEVLVNCSPLFNYGTTGGTWTYSGDGYDTMRVAAREGSLELSITGTIPLVVLSSRCYGCTTIAAGESAFVTLSWGGNAIPATQDEAFSALNRTIDFWRDWLSIATVPDHPWRIYLDRSALTLKGLSYSSTGAIMAASTTSLPETPGGARNWDYRYTWIRDSAFMLRALYRLGFDWEAVEYFAFVIDAISGGDLNRPFELQIMYGIGGERRREGRIWPNDAGMTSDPNGGRQARMRSRPRCWTRVFRAAASSGSTTRPMNSTRRCCSSRLWVSSLPRISGSGRLCWPSPMS